MANLETLELTINANAQAATQGIGSLTRSLSALSTAVGKSVSGLVKLNAELAKVKQYSGMKLPTLAAAKGASAAVDNAKHKTLEEIKAWQAEIKTTYTNGLGWTKGFETEEERRAKNPQWYQTTEQRKEGILLRNEQLRIQEELRQSANKTTEAVKEQTEGIKEETETVKASAKEANASSYSFRKVREGFGSLMKGTSTFFSKVKRIATTMLIRAAIRGLIKSIKEGVNNLYEWSKLNNGAFAKSLDTLRSKSLELKNSIGASIAPIIQAAIPVINALANAAINAFNWVNQLIALLTGQSSWTKATSGVEAYTDAAKGAGGATKDWLASFDELNVMNSGGGGGGGGAAAQYADMFQEMTKFDDQIREFATFLKDNFEELKTLAIATGIAIASWKLSNAFAESLPLLSKIFGYAGLAGTIAITVGLTWLLANQYMKSGSPGWLFAEALTAAVGSTAAWVMAKQLIGGNAGYYGAAITLTLSAITGIIANISNTDVSAFDEKSIKQNILDSLKMGAAAGLVLKATGLVAGGWALAAAGGVALLTFGITIGLKLLTSRDNIKWGDMELTQSQIDSYVNEKMFSAPVKVLIDQYQVYITERSTLENAITEKLVELNTNLNLLKLGVDVAETKKNIASIIGGEDGTGGLVADIAAMCDMNINQLKLTFSNITAYDGNGNAMSSDVLLSGITGWNKVKAEMEANGKELTQLLMKGAKGELTPEMEAYTQELLEKVMQMSTTITQAKEFGEATAEFKTAALSAMSKGSFEGIVSAYKNYSSQYEETIKKTLKEQIASWYQLSELETDPELKAKYKQIADDLTAGFDKTVEEELKSKTSPGRQLIMDWILGKHEKSSVNSTWTAEYLRGVINTEGLADTIKELLQEGGFKKQEIDVMDLVGFTGWEFLTNDLKKKIIQNVWIDKATIKMLKDLNIPVSEFISFVGWEQITEMGQDEFIKAVTEAYGASSIAALKAKIPNIKATDIIKVVDWKKLTLNQKLEFLNALKSAFGASEAVAAAKAAGINIGELVEEGMASKDAAIQAQAKEWAELIKEGTESKPPVIDPSLKEGSVKKIQDDITEGVNNLKPVVTATAKYATGYPENLKKDAEKQKPTVTANAGFGSGQLSGLKNDVEKLKPKITIGAEKSSTFDSAVNSIISKLKSALTRTISVSINNVDSMKIKLSATGGAATGGIFNSGDLFWANENGVPEMVGRFGNQTGVANQQQIIAGISSGVSAANAEQNALLRRQNEILIGILEKETTVRIGASSAFGRTAQQSLDMYHRATGVNA